MQEKQEGKHLNLDMLGTKHHMNKSKPIAPPPGSWGGGGGRQALSAERPLASAAPPPPSRPWRIHSPIRRCAWMPRARRHLGLANSTPKNKNETITFYQDLRNLAVPDSPENGFVETFGDLLLRTLGEGVLASFAVKKKRSLQLLWCFTLGNLICSRGWLVLTLSDCLFASDLSQLVEGFMGV